jgi:hypothetical protein
MGFEPTPLDYQFHFPHGGHPPRINPDNPRMLGSCQAPILASLPAVAGRGMVGPTVIAETLP